jgi:indole-3-acetate monooxygenase
MSHPLVESARALQPLVRERAAGAEAAGSADVEVVRALANAGLFSICAPLAFGGAEADPLTTIDAIEAVSEADGSAGWVLMIGVESTGIGASHFHPDTAARIFANPAVLICGALNPVGRAVKVDGGFVATGRWPFASGSQHADWFWAQCMVEGRPGEAVEVLVARHEYVVDETWNSPGLRGTGSHDVVINDCFVPDERITRTREVRPATPTVLTGLPLMSRLAYNKVGVATGIARGAIDHFLALANERTPRLARGALLRERPRAQLAVANAEARLGGARGFVRDAVGSVWDTVLRGDTVTTRQTALVRLACSHAVTECATAVTGLFEAAGTAMSDASHPLARCFRDVHVVGQHIMVSPHVIDDAGRVLLGLDPLSAVF